MYCWESELNIEVANDSKSFLFAYTHSHTHVHTHAHKLLIHTLTDCLFLCRLGDQIVSVNSKSLKAVLHVVAVQTLKDSGKNVNLV